jgi:hypothetical protein
VNTNNTLTTSPRSQRRYGWLALCAFLAIAAFFLWEEHRAHLMGAVPYALVLLCPALHWFMHRGHRHGSTRADGGHHDA